MVRNHSLSAGHLGMTEREILYIRGEPVDSGGTHDPDLPEELVTLLIC